MSPALKRTMRILSWLGLALLFGWTISSVPVSEVARGLSGMTSLQVLVLAGLNIAILTLLVYRWRLILLAQGWRIGMRELSGYRLAGFAVSYLTPGMQVGGEPLQVYLLHSRHGLPVPAAAASVTLDRIFDWMANFAFLAAGIAVLLDAFTPGKRGALALVGAAAMLLLVPLAYLLALRRGRLPLTCAVRRVPLNLEWARKRLRPIARLVPPTERQISRLVRCRPAPILGAAGISALIWGLMIVEYGAMLQFLGVEADRSQVVAALTAARLAFLFPLPAGLGVLEAGQVLAMQTLGAGAAAGIAASLLIRVRDLILVAAGLGSAAVYTRPGPISATPVILATEPARNVPEGPKVNLLQGAQELEVES